MLNHHRCCRGAGFTLIEVAIALAVAALLAALALPGFAEQHRHAWRGDVVGRLAQLQLMQERWRGNEPRYASLAELGQSAELPHGRYRLAVVDAGDDGYRLQAQALGAQRADTRCQWLELAVEGGQTIRRSGPDEQSPNDAEDNARCWR